MSESIPRKEMLGLFLLAMGRVWVFFLIFLMAFLFGYTIAKGMVLNAAIAWGHILLYYAVFWNWSRIWTRGDPRWQ